MKKLVPLLVLALALNAAEPPLAALPQAKAKASPAKIYADHYRKKLPLRIDIYTSLVDLIDIQNSLFYRYHINDTKLVAVSKFSKAQLKEYEKRLVDSALKQICNDKDVRQMFELGIKIWGGFYTPNSRLLFDFKIDKMACGLY